MKKLSLHLEDLAVESFETTDEAAASRGTVRGAQVSQTTCQQIICDCQTNGFECETNYNCETHTCPEPTDETCRITCGDSCTFFCSRTCPVNTCAYSCEGTCGCPTWSPNETCGIC
ncbi:hypothetical protein [Longimicrobium sp.]|uniref:hypothetical protein n=1 Tax=Longimicrobium sp. TaxID=2029185 RepID=UPI003B3AC83E